MHITAQHIRARSFVDYPTAWKKRPGKDCLHQCLVVTKKYTGVSAGQEMMSSAHNAFKVQVFLFLVAKIESALQATETTFCLKIDVKTIRFIYIFCGDFFLHSQPTAIC